MIDTAKLAWIFILLEFLRLAFVTAGLVLFLRSLWREWKDPKVGRMVRGWFGKGKMTMNIEQIARVCHDANESYCCSIGDYSQNSWDDAEEWQRQSAIKGVEFALANPGASASAQHEAWLADKERDGWKFGPTKDAAKKEHPCMVPYAELPLEQRVKDHLFRALVRAFVEANSPA